MHLDRALRFQAEACAEMGSPMYAELLSRVADDHAAGGPSTVVLRGHEDDPGPSALGLRLLGSVHRLVLERRAGALAAYYPSVGGTWEPEGGWRAFSALLAEDPDAVREWLDRPPQTNEVGRATALYGGLLQVPGGLPLRLREIGSSAGLNLHADRFGYVDDRGTAYGDPSAAVVLRPAWQGRPLEPRPVEVLDRRGSDPSPVDPATTEGRLLLTSYVWADHTDRFERLRAALATAQQTPVPVERRSARDFVEGLDLVDGTTTVLWHSVMWQYLDVDEQQAVTGRLDALGRQATSSRRLARLCAEPMRRDASGDFEFLVALWTWSGEAGDGERRVLGRTTGHGVPTTWE